MFLANRMMTSAAGSSSGYTISNSVYGDGSTGYFTWTPGVAPTSNKTWDFSFWIKASSLASVTDAVFSAANAGSHASGDGFHFNADWDGAANRLRIACNTDAGVIHSTQIFRDLSAFNHIYIKFDTTQATATDRMRWWINGTEQTSSVTRTNPALNATLSFGASGVEHRVLRRTTAYSNAYLAQFYGIDGGGTTVASFGETDITTGSWKPKAYSGTYGTNGFYLPFTESSNLGTDMHSGTITATDLQTKLLLHGDGTDAATTFTDNSTYNKTATVFGNAQLDTAQSKFGTASMLFDGTGDYITFPDSDDYNFGTGDFTIECWVRLNSVSGKYFIVGQDAETNPRWMIRLAFSDSNGLEFTTHNGTSWIVNCIQGSNSGWAINTWYHIACVRNGSSWKAYRNGVQIATDTQSVTWPDISQVLSVGGDTFPANYFDGWIDELRIIKGTAVYTGAFTPPASAFTSITQGNHFTKTGTVTQTTDSPTDNAGSNIGNFCTLNPANMFAGGGTPTLSNGNLTVASSAGYSGVCGTIPIKQNSVFSVKPTAIGAGNSGIGVIGSGVATTIISGAASGNGRMFYRAAGSIEKDSATVTTVATYTTNDKIRVEVNYGAQTIEFFKNNTSVYSGALPAGYTEYLPWLLNDTNTSVCDFGPTPFGETPTSGFKALCTANLPAPTIKKASSHFNVVTYTGTGATRSITGVGFQPDFVWIKSRNTATTNHQLYNSIRGANKFLYSNSTSAEQAAYTDILTSFDSDGFSLGADASTLDCNASGRTYVAWCWKGNGAGSSNTSGTITSTVSANTTAGFSVVTYTGTGANATVGHGLGVAPKLVIVKSRSAVTSWATWHTTFAGTEYIYLNQTLAKQTATPSVWNSTIPTSTVFSIGTDSSTNWTSSDTYVAYCFAEIAGFSKFGSYTGNGAADGPFVWCGFRPKWLLVKDTTTGGAGSDWRLIDTARDTYNDGTPTFLYPNQSLAEDASGLVIDVLSNGFKVRSATYINVSTNTYIFAAFAEFPFGGTGTTQGKAR